MYAYMHIYQNVEVLFLQHDYIQVPIYRYYTLLCIHSISLNYLYPFFFFAFHFFLVLLCTPGWLCTLYEIKAGL